MKFKSCEECPAEIICKSSSSIPWAYGGLECVKFLNAMEEKLKSDNTDSQKLPNIKEFVNEFYKRFNRGNEQDMYTTSIIMNCYDMFRQLSGVS